MTQGYRQLAVVTNHAKAEANAVADGIVAGAASREMVAARVVDGAPLPDATDVVVGVGGDGTLLAAVAAAYPADIPVIGVNLGRVGYLTDVDPEDVAVMLDALAAGDVAELPRMVVAARTDSAGPWYGINDVVLEKVLSQRIVHIGVEIAGEYFTTYRADGLIVATPLGSTAYSLSSGGPVVDPSLDALILTPVAPHSLLSRSIVIAPDASLVFTVGSDRQVRVNLDGREAATLAEGERLYVERGDRPVRFLTTGAHPFPQAVRRQFGIDHA